MEYYDPRQCDFLQLLRSKWKRAISIGLFRHGMGINHDMLRSCVGTNKALQRRVGCGDVLSNDQVRRLTSNVCLRNPEMRTGRLSRKLGSIFEYCDIRGTR